MAQQGHHGKNAKIYVGAYDVTAYFKKFSIKRSAEAPENTTIGDNDRERETDGMLDGSMSGSGKYDDATGAIDEQLSGILGAQQTEVSVYPGGASAVGDIGYGMVGIEGEYAHEKPYDDIVAFSFSIDSDNDGDPLNEGAERQILLHPSASRNSDGNGTIHDLGAAKDNGGSAYVHITSFSGTSLALFIEHGAAADLSDAATVGTFTVATAVGSERIALPAGTGAIKRYVRIRWDVTTATATFVAGIHIHT